MYSPVSYGQSGTIGCTGLIDIYSSIVSCTETLHRSYTSAVAPGQLPGTLCILCSFAEDSEAQGCFGEIVPLTSKVISFNATRRDHQPSVLHCTTGLDTGVYTVKIGEIECTGLQGPMTHVEVYDVPVIGLSSEDSMFCIDLSMCYARSRIHVRYTAYLWPFIELVKLWHQHQYLTKNALAMPFLFDSSSPESGEVHWKCRYCGHLSMLIPLTLHVYTL